MTTLNLCVSCTVKVENWWRRMVRIRRRLLIIRFALTPRVVDDGADFIVELMKLLLFVVAADSGMVERVVTTVDTTL